MATIKEHDRIMELARLDLPNDMLSEVINGQVVEKPEVGSYPVEVASILHEYLGPFVRRMGLGRSIVEILFLIDRSNQYRPDLAYISRDRWPMSRRAPRAQPWEIVPDVTIEVVSETDRAENLLRKTKDYVNSGVRAV